MFCFILANQHVEIWELGRLLIYKQKKILPFSLQMQVAVRVKHVTSSCSGLSINYNEKKDE